MHKGKLKCKFKSGMCLIYKNSGSVANILRSESLKCLILVAGNLYRPMLLRFYYPDCNNLLPLSSSSGVNL